MSLGNPDSAMICPICLDTMRSPILQCQRGHSMCGDCITVTKVSVCPCCRGSLLNPIRNHHLEDLIEGLKDVLKINCYFAKKGCKYVLSKKEQEDHESECKYRVFTCGGKKFNNWKCNWTGDLGDIYKHFKDCHKNNALMEYRTEANMKINFRSDYYDIQIINFHNGQNYFYYKHKVDVSERKAYWIFQFIGMKTHAKHYYYEFEVHSGPTRKFKVTEICENDTADVDELFKKEKCVVMSFNTIQNYLNEEGELPFKFRIMSIKKTTVQ